MVEFLPAFIFSIIDEVSGRIPAHQQGIYGLDFYDSGFKSAL
jgi:hypothetical protein